MLPRVVFHHVHKCAGTTILKFLEGTTSPQRTAAIERLVGDPDPTGADRIAALLRAELIHDPFGVHDWKGLLGNTVDVIFLRDPVERLWSEWRPSTAAWSPQRGPGPRPAPPPPTDSRWQPPAAWRAFSILPVRCSSTWETG